MSERGFFGELMHRRVPQYLGLYIAGVWLGIEMGDWLSEQFTMPDRLTTYIFVFMAVMLPSVALFAWNHGAPGKDETSKAELVFVPLNVVLAVVGVALVPERAPEPAVAAAVDAQAQVAPEKPQSKRLAAFFLTNATSEAPDWYAYALPMLLAEDLRRESPAFRVLTPFDNNSMLDEMRAAGFENAMRVPQSLQVKLAQQRRYSYFFRGELDDAEDGGFVLRYALHDTASGEPRVAGEETFDDSSLFAAVDRVSAAIREELRQNLSETIQVTNLPVSESMSDDLEAIRLYTEARIVANIDVDGPRGGELLKAAVEADPQFAEAHGALGMHYYFSGRNDLAQASFDEALRYGFRLSRGTEFMLKINKAAINGDFVGALDVARTWTRVEPGSETAHLKLAELNALTGQDFEEALRAYERVRELNPMSVGTLKASANLERQRGDVEAAEALLQEYVASAPGDADGLASLAQLHAAQGEYDEAISVYREAAILDSLSVTPELGIIGVLMRRGDYAQAEDRLTQLRSRDLTAEQQLEVLTLAVTMYTQLGQYREAEALLVEAEPIMERLAGPLMTALQAKAPRIVQRGYVLDDPEPVIEELNALGNTLQQPWPDFIALYKAGLLAAHDDREAFLGNMPALERFAATQPGNGNLQFMADSYRALAAVYRGEPDTGVSLVRDAIARSERSFLAVFLNAEILSIQTEMYDILRRAGEVRDAVAGLEGIIANYPGLALAHLRLAQAYLDLGREGPARQALDTVKSIWQDADDGFIYLDDVSRVESELAERA